jgi:cytochrome oxidase Cu insertion factor (SCO1/SenC/PrrC family)
MTAPPWTRSEKWAVGALAALAAITLSWWALALWPVPTGAPTWLARTRQVCFGALESGLPNAGGWLLLVGQPIGMAAAMFVIWGKALRGGLWALGRTVLGKAALGATLLVLFLGTIGVGIRVAGAQPEPIVLDDPGLPPSTYPRLDRPVPELGLVDQRGDLITLDHLAGRTVLVTFGFGHCETICPVVVHNTLEAAAAVPELDPVVVVVTLDPWRDTPTRLPYLAEQWGLEGEAYLLGGEVDQVQAVLDAWGVARERDTRTGDVTHPALVYIVDDGRIAYATTGDARTVAALALRL